MNYQTFSWHDLQVPKTLQIQSIFNTPTRKEIAILMPEGSSMPDHSAPGEIVVQVLRGEIEFSLCADTLRLGELNSICVAPNVVHSLNAIKPSIVRLSLAKNDSAARVSSLIFKAKQ